MTLHWKDDLRPLKQICLVDVESTSDPCWITIVKKPINYILLNGCKNRYQKELARRLSKTLYNRIIMKD